MIVLIGHGSSQSSLGLCCVVSHVRCLGAHVGVGRQIKPLSTRGSALVPGRLRMNVKFYDK